MIRIRLKYQDLFASPQMQGGNLILGSGHLLPYSHSALATWLFKAGREWAFIVAERLPSLSSASGDRQSTVELCALPIERCRELNELIEHFENGEAAYIVVACRPQESSPEFSISIGNYCPIPIYFSMNADAIMVSFDFIELASQRSVIDDLVVSHMLTGRRYYSSRTPVVGVSLLTQGSSVTFRQDNISFVYPAPIWMDRPLRDNSVAEVAVELQDLITNFFKQRPVVSQLMV